MNTMTPNSTSNTTTPASSLAPSPVPPGAIVRVHRGIWIGGALMGLTIVALATALVVKSNGSDTAPVAAAPADATTATTAAAMPDGTAAATPVNPPAAATPVPANTAPQSAYPDPPATTIAPNAGYGTDRQVAAASPDFDTPPRTGIGAAAACTGCGTVESYAAVQVEGQTNGVGAVAGGVGGALIGSQIGGRGSHTVGGLIGAIGGGLLGNAIEKHERTTTVYEVHVRMNDGSERTVRQSTIPTVGSRVRIEGHTLHRLPSPPTGPAPTSAG